MYFWLRGKHFTVSNQSKSLPLLAESRIFILSSFTCIPLISQVVWKISRESRFPLQFVQSIQIVFWVSGSFIPSLHLSLLSFSPFFFFLFLLFFCLSSFSFFTFSFLPFSFFLFFLPFLLPSFLFISYSMFHDTTPYTQEILLHPFSLPIHFPPYYCNSHMSIILLFKYILTL